MDLSLVKMAGNVVAIKCSKSFIEDLLQCSVLTPKPYMMEGEGYDEKTLPIEFQSLEALHVNSTFQNKWGRTSISFEKDREINCYTNKYEENPPLICK